MHCKNMFPADELKMLLAGDAIWNIALASFLDLLVGQSAFIVAPTKRDS